MSIFMKTRVRRSSISTHGIERGGFATQLVEWLMMELGRRSLMLARTPGLLCFYQACEKNDKKFDLRLVTEGDALLNGSMNPGIFIGIE